MPQKIEADNEVRTFENTEVSDLRSDHKTIVFVRFDSTKTTLK